MCERWNCSLRRTTNMTSDHHFQENFIPHWFTFIWFITSINLDVFDPTIAMLCNEQQTDWHLTKDSFSLLSFEWFITSVNTFMSNKIHFYGLSPVIILMFLTRQQPCCVMNNRPTGISQRTASHFCHFGTWMVLHQYESLPQITALVHIIRSHSYSTRWAHGPWTILIIAMLWMNNGPSKQSNGKKQFCLHHHLHHHHRLHHRLHHHHHHCKSQCSNKAKDKKSGSSSSSKIYDILWQKETFVARVGNGRRSRNQKWNVNHHQVYFTCFVNNRVLPRIAEVGFFSTKL
jgi:hypothetical protein